MNSLTIYSRKIAPALFCASRNYSQGSITKSAANSSSGTVDPSEIKFHSDLSNEWWDKNGPMKGLHEMNKIRIQFVRSGLINAGLLNEKETLNNPQYMEGLSIADVGCGGGILSLSLARLGCNVVGVEPSKELVSVAKSKVEQMKLSGKTDFIAISIEEYAKVKAETHDAVICSEVIEHVTQKEEFIKACVNILKPGGCIFFTTLNRTLPGRLLSIYAAEYLLRLLPIGTHQYEKFITPEELSKILENYGCQTEMVNGFLYSPIDNSFYWVPSTSVQYALHAVKSK